MPSQRQVHPQCDDRTDYAMMLLVFAGLAFAASLLVMWIIYEWRAGSGRFSLGMLALIAAPSLSIFLVAATLCFLGLIKRDDWLRGWLGRIWWLFIDDGEAPYNAVPPNADSAAGVVSQAMDQVGESVKNALIDFGISADAPPPVLLPPSLPHMERSDFIAALRPRVDALLARMADAINSAPTGSVLEVGKERVHPLLYELEQEALIQGLRLRINAAYQALPKDRRPEGDWARRYRLMISAGRGASL